jgi:hypothetical protein
VKERAFKTEADLCAAFIGWANGHEGVQCFAEWAGWDILVVLPEGLQLGIQAKLRLNADVILQALPSRYDYVAAYAGPDFRGVLVPATNPLSGLASQLGLVVLSPERYSAGFCPGLLDYTDTPSKYSNPPWADWNPPTRHELPPSVTDAIAGSPCPVTLTQWKLAALDVLAELAVKGSITAKRIRELGVHPGRWTQYWLRPGENRGDWVRGDRCPRFDEQHPTAYALALKKAQEGPAA